jgi:hypothetical protein
MLKKWGPSTRSREEGTFSATRQTAKTSRRNAVIVILAACAVGGWLYVFFGPNFFRVTQVDVGDLLYSDRGEVMSIVFDTLDERGKMSWNRRNILLVDIPALEQELETRLYAENVTVDKVYPHILRLNVQERQSTVIVIANNEFYLVDRSGIGVERISSEEEAAVLQRIADPSSTSPQDLPVLTVHGRVQFEPGQEFVSEWTVLRWLEAFRALGDASFGYRKAEVDYATSTKLILDLYEPYDAYFDLLAPMPPQINGFYAFMRAKSDDATIREYVDVRVPGKVYYK